MVAKIQGNGSVNKTAGTAPAKPKAQPKAGNKPVVNQNAQTKKEPVLREPKKPTPKEITVTMGTFDTLSELAEKHHTTVKDIQKLNNIKDPNKLKEGQKIRIMAISDKEYKEYQTKLNEYNAKQAEIKRKQDVQRKKAKAQGLIEKAKKDGRGEDYNYAINPKTGNIVVTLKNDRNMGRIKEDFHLPAGSISSTNNMEEKFGKIPTYHTDSRSFETWDAVKVKKGTSLEINTDHFQTERTWKQAWKDFWK